MLDSSIARVITGRVSLKVLGIRWGLDGHLSIFVFVTIGLRDGSALVQSRCTPLPPGNSILNGAKLARSGRVATTLVDAKNFSTYVRLLL